MAGVAAIYSFFYEIYDFFRSEIKYQIKIRQPLSSTRREILNKYFGYYKVLSSADKLKFENRVQRFIYSKRFIARSVPEVTEEMKVLISASAIQLTFGLSEIYLSNFDKILIYADSYYSNITKNYHRGEVNPRLGIIILAWKHFVEGYGDMNDSFNVGIHEMAHALHFENRIRNDEYDFLDEQVLEKFEEIMRVEIPKIRAGEPHLFRPYAGVNQYEFFAVSLEYFFENPIAFKTQLPVLYKTIATLINRILSKCIILSPHSTKYHDELGTTSF